MPTYNSTLQFYNQFGLNVGSGAHALPSNTYKVLLVSSSYTPDLEAHTDLSDITNELSGSGYSRQTLTGVTWTRTGATAKLDFNNPQFSASGGTLTARRYVVFDDTANLLMATGLINDADVDVAITDGNQLTINVAAGGFFTLG